MSNQTTKKQIVLKTIRIVLVSLCMVFLPHQVVAASTQTEEDIDLVFALDVSGSMNKKDEDKTAIELMKMIVDVLGYENNRVGFVAYNDTIAYSYDLTDADSTCAEKIKEYMDTVSYSGETDIGLGVKEAVEMAKTDSDEDREKVIILLSDGKTDLSGSSTSRTEADSEEDLQSAIETASEEGITIFPIRLNDTLDSDVDYLSQVAKETNGESYLAFSPLELMDKMNDILSRYQIPTLENVSTKSGTGDIQEISLSIENDYVNAMRIYVLSNCSLDHVGLVGLDGEVSYGSGKRYSVINIDDIDGTTEKNFMLYFQGAKKSDIQVYVQDFYSLSPAILLDGEIIGDTVTRSQTEQILFSFTDNKTGDVLEGDTLLEDMQFTCELVNTEDESTKGLSYKKAENGILFENALTNTGTYEMKITYSGSSLSGTYVSEPFEIINQDAEELNELSKTVYVKKETVSYALKELFGSEYEKGSTYSIVSSDGDSIDFSIEESKLTGTILKTGAQVLVLEEQDAANNLYRVTLTVTSKTFWEMYQVLIAGILIALIMLLAFLVSMVTITRNRRGKKKITAQFEGNLIGYFVDLKSANEFPPLKWDLRRYPGNGVSVAQLFLDAGITDRFIGSDKVWFYPNKDGGIDILHNLKGSIFIGTKIVNRDMPVTVYSGEKIYISFDENGVEIELRYQG